MSVMSRAGAGCLLAGALLGLASVLSSTTLSEKEADQAAAFTVHRGAMELGLAFGALAACLLVGGVVWLAYVTWVDAPRLARVGGVLGVFGLLPVLFGDGVSAAGVALVHGMNTVQATSALHRLGGGAIEAIDPVSLFGDIGLVLLGIAVIRVGVPRWAGAAMVFGAIGQGAAFGAGFRPVAIVGFALLLIGFAGTVRTVGIGPRTVHDAAAIPQPA